MEKSCLFANGNGGDNQCKERSRNSGRALVCGVDALAAERLVIDVVIRRASDMVWHGRIVQHNPGPLHRT